MGRSHAWGWNFKFHNKISPHISTYKNSFQHNLSIKKMLMPTFMIIWVWREKGEIFLKFFQHVVMKNKNKNLEFFYMEQLCFLYRITSSFALIWSVFACLKSFSICDFEIYPTFHLVWLHSLFQQLSIMTNVISLLISVLQHQADFYFVSCEILHNFIDFVPEETDTYT